MDERGHDLRVVFCRASQSKVIEMGRQHLPSGTNALRPFGTSGLSTVGVASEGSAILNRFLTRKMIPLTEERNYSQASRCSGKKWQATTFGGRRVTNAMFTPHLPVGERLFRQGFSDAALAPSSLSLLG